MSEVILDERFDFDDGLVALDDRVAEDALELAVQGFGESVYHV